MWTVRLRYSGLGLFLLVLVVGLLFAWLRLSHLVFAAIAFSLVFFGSLSAAGWDTWRQTDQGNLAARGIYADDRTLPAYDPGLRREYAPLIPSRGSKRPPGNRFRRQPDPSAARRQPARVVGGRQPAQSGGGRQPSRNAGSRQSGRGGRQPQRVSALKPDATVTLADEGQETGIEEVFAALDRDLVGLLPVKQKVAEIGSLLLVDRARLRFGLSSTRPSLHMCFTGAPGTGKTTVALMMAEMLHRLGYLEQGHLVHAMRDDLVGEFIGHTAPKTKQVLARAMGGVLFIDEAYSLYRAEDSKDYGQEAVDILMQVMENERDRLVVILAGYKDRMDRFFDSNPGLSSRVAHHVNFAPYRTDELLAIGQLMLNRSSYYLADEAEAALRDYLAVEKEQPRFAHARSVRNVLEGARLRHAHRLAAEPGRPWHRDDLMRLEAEDIVPSLDPTAALTPNGDA
jgi:probable Rubsico expression protein CbbX